MTLQELYLALVERDLTVVVPGHVGSTANEMRRREWVLQALERELIDPLLTALCAAYGYDPEEDWDVDWPAPELASDEATP